MLAGGRTRIPYEFGDAGGHLGATDRFGNIKIKPGLRGRDLRETVLHEGVHRFFSPRNTGPISVFRAKLGEQAYLRSSFLRYIEEGLAEGIAKRSLRAGLTYPIRAGYVSFGRTLLEAGIVAGGVGGAAYGAYQWVSADD